MSTICLNILAAAVIFGAMTTSATAQSTTAQDNGDRTVDQFTCKDILREYGAPREVAIAFMHGYLLAKAGATNFNLTTLSKQTDDFIDRCLENSKEKAMDTMMKVKQ
jgi:hypothetical protein